MDDNGSGHHEDWPGRENPRDPATEAPVSEDFLRELNRPPRASFIYPLVLLLMLTWLFWNYLFADAGADRSQLWQELWQHELRIPSIVLGLVILCIVGYRLVTGRWHDSWIEYRRLAHVNLVDHGLLREALTAQWSHDLLPPIQGSLLQMELRNSNMRLATPQERILYLIANYEPICNSRGWRWADWLRSMPFSRVRRGILSSELDTDPARRQLRRVVAELLRSGNY